MAMFVCIELSGLISNSFPIEDKIVISIELSCKKVFSCLVLLSKNLR